MTSPRREPITSARRIPLPRLVVGILLHFCVPAYLLASLVAAFAVDPPVASAAAVLPRMLWTGAWFVPAFLLVMAVSAGVAALMDRPKLRISFDPAEWAAIELREAQRLLVGLNDRRLNIALDRIKAVSWDLRDERDQQVIEDLAVAAAPLVEAVASASAERRPELLSLAAESVERIATAAELLAVGRSRLDEGDARTVARYLAIRYGE